MKRVLTLIALLLSLGLSSLANATVLSSPGIPGDGAVSIIHDDPDVMGQSGDPVSTGGETDAEGYPDDSKLAELEGVERNGSVLEWLLPFLHLCLLLP